MMFNYLGYLLLVVVAVMFLAAAIRILREYERGVVFTLGCCATDEDDETGALHSV